MMIILFPFFRIIAISSRGGRRVFALRLYAYPIPSSSILLDSVSCSWSEARRSSATRSLKQRLSKSRSYAAFCQFVHFANRYEMTMATGRRSKSISRSAQRPNSATASAPVAGKNIIPSSTRQQSKHSKIAVLSSGGKTSTYVILLTTQHQRPMS